MSQKLPAKFKKAIRLLSEDEKENIIFQLCERFPEVFEFAEFEYTKTYDSFITYQKELNSIMQFKPLRREIQVDIANAINLGIKKITQFKKETKSNRLEIALMLHLLKITFKNYDQHLGSRYTSFDTKAALLVKKVIALIKKNRPEKTWVNYGSQIDEFIELLKTKAPHVRAVINLPNYFV